MYLYLNIFLYLYLFSNRWNNRKCCNATVHPRKFVLFKFGSIATRYVSPRNSERSY